jgi:hypothetical protein
MRVSKTLARQVLSLGLIVCSLPLMALKCPEEELQNALDQAQDAADDLEDDADTVLSICETSFPSTTASRQLRLDAGSLAATHSNGQAVPLWIDCAGKTAIQSAPASQPVFQTLGPNSRPSVRFDGTDDLISVADDLLNFMGAMNFVLVVKLNSGGDGLLDPWANNRGIFSKGSGPVNNVYLQGDNWSGTNEIAFYSGGAGSIMATNVMVDEFAVIGAMFDGASMRFNLNGDTGIQGFGFSNSVTAEPLIIGANHMGAGDYREQAMELAEAVFFNGQLTMSELEEIGCFYKAKYNLTMYSGGGC